MPNTVAPSALSAGARRCIVKGRGGSEGGSIGIGSARSVRSAGGVEVDNDL